MNKAVRLLLCAAGSFAAAGCGLVGGGQSVASAERGAIEEYFAGQLAEGKEHLQAGRLASAIGAFRQAAGRKDQAAEALNGMAIAYDRLGRGDLARRYFTEALALAPQDERIERNLARLELRQAALAFKQAQDRAEQVATAEAAATELEAQALAAAPVAEPSAAAAAAPAPAPAPAPRPMRRAAEVALVSKGSGVALQAAGTPSAAAPAVVAVENAARYPVRVQIMRRPKAHTSAYPVRVALAPRGR